MKKITIILTMMLFMFLTSVKAQTIQGGISCSEAAPICTGSQYVYPLQTDSVAEIGPNYGCLMSQPNPSWYYLKILQSGNINMSLLTNDSTDIDYVIWGPFSNITCDNNDLSSSNIVDCSWDVTQQEFPKINNAQVGEFYMFLITNFSGTTHTFSLTQISGTGSTDCSILSIANIEKETNIKVYPNPATDNVQVIINNEKLIGSIIEIVNLHGKVVKQITADKEQLLINLSNNAKGIYYVKVITENGVSTHKLVLE